MVSTERSTVLDCLVMAFLLQGSGEPMGSRALWVIGRISAEGKCRVAAVSHRSIREDVGMVGRVAVNPRHGPEGGWCGRGGGMEEMGTRSPVLASEQVSNTCAEAPSVFWCGDRGGKERVIGAELTSSALAEGRNRRIESMLRLNVPEGA